MPDELFLDDPREIHALAHPVRLALIDLLRERETATATECAPLVGESVQSCAYHLRTLAKFKVVEETASGDGRERRWRLRVAGFSVPKLVPAPPQRDAAWAELRARVVERDIAILREFVEDEHSFRPEQRRLATVRNLTLHATPAELEQLADEIAELLRRYMRDEKRERPDGSERVHAVFWLVPRREGEAR